MTTLRERLLGSWRAVAWEWYDEHGAVESPIANPVGLLMYDDAGTVSVQLMQPGQQPFGDDDFRRASDGEKISAWNGYFCYFGTYSVDAETATVTHRVDGSLFPNIVGTDQVRRCQISGDLLTMTAEAAWGRVVLTWEKIVG